MWFKYSVFKKQTFTLTLYLWWVTFRDIIEGWPVATGKVVEVVTGINTLIHSSLDLYCQIQTRLTHTHIRGGRRRWCWFGGVQGYKDHKKHCRHNQRQWQRGDDDFRYKWGRSQALDLRFRHISPILRVFQLGGHLGVGRRHSGGGISARHRSKQQSYVAITDKLLRGFLGSWRTVYKLRSLPLNCLFFHRQCNGIYRWRSMSCELGRGQIGAAQCCTIPRRWGGIPLTIPNGGGARGQSTAKETCGDAWISPTVSPTSQIIIHLYIKMLWKPDNGV